MPGTKIGTYHLCEPAPSKCTWANHKIKNAGHQNRDAQFARAYAIEMHLRESQEPPVREFTCKMPGTKIGMHMDKSRQVTTATENLKEKCCRPKSRGRLCAQSKCTWTCQKRQFMQESRGKCRKPGGAPWSRTGLRKNPSVWTQCFGNECGIVWSGAVYTPTCYGWAPGLYIPGKFGSIPELDLRGHVTGHHVDC